ncbi:ABC transporter substrate-binding protein [Pseudomonas sp. SA3-5]|uniref:ABC transporter substrate-binding protein n=1 Tax=Pseudomonas aestuarii TaxID=3018340 RepID=A0ABT4XGW8_9PSED|nr:ABC transporter substrate-binding protein [Pseudomonas aestuarii]MDA7087453.1 ABC transporter substrate-binding protein [Pseudomonas aestuarii]
MAAWLVRLLAAWLLCSSAAATELRLYTEENPPINFSHDGQLDGLAIAAVRELLRRTGDSGTIHMLPWARGYLHAQGRANVGLFVTVRTPEREALFQWVGPLLSTTTSFYARSGSGLHIDSLDDARQVAAIGVPRDWYSQQFLEGEGFSNLYLASKPHGMLDMVLHGRIPLMAYEDQLLPSLTAKLGASMADLERHYSFMQSSSYIVFSLQTDPLLVQHWQAALDDMRNDGSLARLQQQWLPDVVLPAPAKD